MGESEFVSRVTPDHMHCDGVGLALKCWITLYTGSGIKRRKTPRYQ